MSVVHHYRLQYYEALDSTIAGIKNRFNQPGHIMYKSVENLLLNAANKTPYEEKITWIQIFFQLSYKFLAQLSRLKQLTQ